jgi:hypothetical protein
MVKPVVEAKLSREGEEESIIYVIRGVDIGVLGIPVGNYVSVRGDEVEVRLSFTAPKVTFNTYGGLSGQGVSLGSNIPNAPVSILDRLASVKPMFISANAVNAPGLTSTQLNPPPKPKFNAANVSFNSLNPINNINLDSELPASLAASGLRNVTDVKVNFTSPGEGVLIKPNELELNSTVASLGFTVPTISFKAHGDLDRLGVGLDSRVPNAPTGASANPPQVKPMFTDLVGVKGINLASNLPNPPLNLKPSLAIVNVNFSTNPSSISGIRLNGTLPGSPAATNLSYLADVKAVFMSLGEPAFINPNDVGLNSTIALRVSREVASTASLSEIDRLITEVEDITSRDRLLFGLGRVVPDRALVIVARRIGGFGYIEFLKRVLREVYRVSIGGLPNPKHVSHSEDLTLLMPIEVGAGGRLFVIDLTSGNLRELLKDDVRLARIKERVKDRLRELFSQGFGFIVIYGDGGEDCDYTSNDYKNIKDSKKENKEDKACVSEFIKGMWIKFYGEKILEYHSTVPSPIEVNLVVDGLDAKSSREFYAVLASVMWGRVSKPIADYSGFGGFDEFIVWLEDGYWRALEGALRDFDIRLKVKPSAEGDEHSLESMSHYLTKAAMVNYLVRELTEEFRSKGIEEDETRVKALECVETEYQLGNVRFDVYVKPNCGSRLDGLVVEVETLYGTGTVVHKVLDTVESRVKAGVNRLWVIVPNPQATILLPQLLKLERHVKERHGEGVEFHTLDITETEPKPVRLIEAAKILIGEWRRLKGGGGW